MTHLGAVAEPTAAVVPPAGLATSTVLAGCNAFRRIPAGKRNGEMVLIDHEPYTIPNNISSEACSRLANVVGGSDRWDGITWFTNPMNAPNDCRLLRRGWMRSPRRNLRSTPHEGFDICEPSCLLTALGESDHDVPRQLCVMAALTL